MVVTFLCQACRLTLMLWPQWERLGPIGATLSSADKNELIATTHLSGASDAKIRNFFKNQDTYVNIDEIVQLIDNVMSTRFLRRH
jgi:hypothetical protein